MYRQCGSLHLTLKDSCAKTWHEQESISFLEKQQDQSLPVWAYKHLRARRIVDCLQGKARCALQAGEMQKGVQLAIDLNNPWVLRNCAAVLLSVQQETHAAALFSKARDNERAAALYIQVRRPCYCRGTLDLRTQRAARAKRLRRKGSLINHNKRFPVKKLFL